MLQTVRLGLGGGALGFVLALQAIGFGSSCRRLRLILTLQAIRFGLGGSACASFSRVKRSASCLRFDPRRFGFACDALGLGLRGRSFVLRDFALRRRLALVREALFLLTLHGDRPGVFRRLHGLPRRHRHRFLAGFAGLVGFGLLQVFSAFWKVSAAKRSAPIARAICTALRAS